MLEGNAAKGRKRVSFAIERCDELMIICGGRRSGKTTELIKHASKHNLYILCANKIRVKNVVEIAKELKLEIPFPITLSELPLKGRSIKEICVDDIDEILYQLLSIDVESFTVTESEIIKLKCSQNATDQKGDSNL